MTRPDLHIVPPSDFVERFQFVPSHSQPTWRDDFADFVNDIRDNPHLAGVCVGGGIVTGCFVTVGLALIVGLLS